MGKSFTIRPRKTAKGCVSQGARLLDHYRPGWEKTVKGAMVNHKFDMGDWPTCIAGTVEVYKRRMVTDNEILDPWESKPYVYEEEFLAFNGLEFSVDDDRAIWVGFLDGYTWDLDDLEKLWKAEIEKRLDNAS